MDNNERRSITKENAPSGVRSAFNDRWGDFGRKDPFDELMSKIEQTQPPQPNEQQAPAPKQEEFDRPEATKGSFSLKEKLLTTLGFFGGILWFFVLGLICFLPLAMIGTSFWVNLLLFGIMYFIPSTSGIFWVWGLVCAIQGQQDIWAIIYYVLFVVLFLPYFISVIANLIRAFIEG